MPYRVTFELDAFNGTRDAEMSAEDLSSMLDCLIAIDSNFLRRSVGQDGGRNPAVPLLYASGVKYAEEPSGAEFWRDIPTVLRYTDGDCEDLVCWLVAEKRVRFGLPARPIIIPQLQANGRYLYHIQMWSPDVPGGVDDPSARLGMPVPGASAPPANLRHMFRAMMPGVF